MGGGGGGDQKSSSSTKETALSKEQAFIVKQRNEQYNELFYPELKNMLKDVQGNTMTTSSMASQAKNINQSSKSSKNVFVKAMAQRGIEGSGVEAQGLAAIEGAKVNSLSNAFYQAQQANTAQKNTVMQFGTGMSPKPTTAAPLASESSSTASNFNFSVG